MDCRAVLLGRVDSGNSALNCVLLSLLFLIGLSATISVVRFAGFSAYIWLMLLATLLLVFTGKLTLHFNLFSLLLLSASVTCFLTIQLLSPAYQDNSIKALFALVLTSVVGMSVFPDWSYRNAFYRGLLLSVKIQTLWIFLQTACWAFLKLDLNDLIFSQILGMVETASQYKATGLVSTGLCWNAGGIAAAFYFFMIFEKKTAWKILVILASIMTQSSTIMIGVSLILLAGLLNYVFDEKRSYIFSRTSLLLVALIFVVGCFAFILIPGIKSSVEPVVSVLFDRIAVVLGLADSADSSFIAHASYYTNLPQLVSNMDLQSLLFGYGNDCSGLPYTALTRQYWTLDSWMLESDYINLFLSQGVFGITVWIIWLCSSIARAMKNRNNRIALFFMVMMVGGIFYNLQSVLYYWVTLLELSLLFDIKQVSICPSCTS